MHITTTDWAVIITDIALLLYQVNSYSRIRRLEIMAGNLLHKIAELRQELRKLKDENSLL